MTISIYGYKIVQIQDTVDIRDAVFRILYLVFLGISVPKDQKDETGLKSCHAF